MGGVMMKPDGFTPMLDETKSVGVPPAVFAWAQHAVDRIASCRDVCASKWTSVRIINQYVVCGDGYLLQCTFSTLQPCFPLPYTKSGISTNIDFSEQIQRVYAWLGTDRYPVYMELSPWNDYTVNIILKPKKSV
jgi:hypothetical protein